MSFVVALTTTANRDDARQIARTLVEEKLVACVNVMPVESFYRWEGKVHDDAEYLLIMKTRRERVAYLEQRLKTIHSYDTPEFIVLDITGGSDRYLAWLTAST